MSQPSSSRSSDPPALPELVDGHTRLFGIIGDPIVQTLSPQSITPLFRAAGFNAVLVPLHVPADRFAETMRGLMSLHNFHGTMVTYPFKVQATTLVDRLLPAGRMVGAINAIRRETDGSWTGDIFDGKGLLAGLQGEGFAISGRRVLLLGAGGAGSAIAFALAEAGIAQLTIHDLDANKAADLAARAGSAYPTCEARTGPARTAGMDLLINATPIGMNPADGLPAEFDAFAPSLVVVDIVPKPDVPLLKEAARQGCRTVDFRVMARGQMDAIARFFRGQ